jgi:hypothetical protein
VLISLVDVDRIPRSDAAFTGIRVFRMNADWSALSIPVSLPRKYSRFYTQPLKADARVFIPIEIIPRKSFYLIDMHKNAQNMHFGGFI